MRSPGQPVLLAVRQRRPAARQPRTVHQVSQDEIRASLADGWRIHAIEPATTGITTYLGGIRTWLAANTDPTWGRIGHIKKTWSGETPGQNGCAARDSNPEPAD
jgi:hypothetical protein